MTISSVDSLQVTGTGLGYAGGTFGELLQGGLADPAVDFLVTLPIEAGSRASFRYCPDAPDVYVWPRDREKSRAVARSMLGNHGMPGGGELVLDTNLPIGKGLASSSADLVATARAVGQAIGSLPTTDEIETLLRGIEPSDGVMHPATVAFCHRDVRLLELLGQLPRLTIVAADEGGEVDTVRFNRVPKQFSDIDRRDYRRLLDILREAIPRGDTVAIGAVATRSAIMNQRLAPKRLLPEILDICLMTGGRGVVAAHSGTVLGILLDEGDPAYADKLRRAVRACSALARTAQVYRSARLAGAWGARGNGHVAAPGGDLAERSVG